MSIIQLIESKILDSSFDETPVIIISGPTGVCQSFSVMDWLVLVEKKLDEIFNKNKIPIIVGGTGLYIKSAINGISKIPKVDKEVLDNC